MANPDISSSSEGISNTAHLSVSYDYVLNKSWNFVFSIIPEGTKSFEMKDEFELFIIETKNLRIAKVLAFSILTF